MDFSSLLPMLMQKGGNGGKPDLAAMAQSMLSQNGKSPTDGKPDLTSILSAMAPKTDGGAAASGNGGFDSASLLSMMKNSGANIPNLELMNLLSTFQKNRGTNKKPHGLKPVKPFIADEILGKMVKFFQ